MRLLLLLLCFCFLVAGVSARIYRYPSLDESKTKSYDAAAAKYRWFWPFRPVPGFEHVQVEGDYDTIYDPK